MAGRKSKYTEEVHNRIVSAVEQGTPYRFAAAYGGISETTLYEWINAKPAFAEAIKAAESRAVVGRLARIRKAEDDHWQAAAWWLERKFPQEFGRTVQENQITGKDGEPIQIIFRSREDGPQ